MHRRRARSIAAILTSLTLLLGLMGSALAVDREGLSATALQPDGDPIHAAKSRSGGLAQTDPALLGRTDATAVPVFIKLDYDAVASYSGDVTGLAATSPEVTGRSLRANQRAVDAYLRHVQSQDAAARGAIESAVPQATVLDSFQIAYGGVSAVVPANRIGDLLAIEGVVAIQQDSLAQLLTDASPDFIGATEAWAQIGDSTTAGEGVIVGVLDSGIWPEHPSLADNGIDHPGGTYACDFGDGGDPDLGEPFTCNDKLIGAYTFVDTYLAFGPDPLEGEFCNDAQSTCSARDANGHGTHTATTAAGSAVDEAVLLGVDQGPISGIAPGAHVIAYRVCLDQGCYGSDSVAAVEQAILDGVDVLNFSISGGANAYTDPVELAFLDAYAAGILVNASAGNNGPGAGTANHAGPWTNTVGASTSDRHFLTTLELTAGGASLDIVGATVTAGIAMPTDVVLAEDVPGYTDALCQTPLPTDSAMGLVVACERGVIARVDKSKNVEPSGAAGMILYNPAVQGLNTDNHFIPTVHIDQPDSAAFLAFMTNNAGVQARWDPGTKTEVTGDVMASFSSRGPLGDFLKPDVTAPGVQILAGHTPAPVGDATGVTGQLYQAIAGTSMSSPHAAGVSALVKASHPDWTPGQIKSALMTSSAQSVLKEDGATPATPFDRGAGSIRANRALSPVVTFDVHANDYYASTTDALSRLHLNLPSVYANPMPGAVQTTRTMTNQTSEDQPFTILTQAPAGVLIAVSPARGSVPAGGSLELSITISAPSAADAVHFGQITVDFRKGGADAVLPVAFNKSQNAVALSHVCAPTTFARNDAASCEVSAANFSPVAAQVSVSVAGPKNNRVRVQNVSAPGVPSGNGFTWSGTLSPALAPSVDGLVEGFGVAGYLPLSLFGIPPVAGMGDETIVNYNVPAFHYGAETYSRIGITSNGYVVVGGGSGADVTYIPQELPDPTRPNNVLAPYWTDLDMGAGGAVRVGILTDNVTDWLVIDWAGVPTWESAGAVSNSFQIWIEVGANESISFAYGAIGGPDGIGLTIGAENRNGTSGAMAPGLPANSANDWIVQTSPSTAGGSVTITYDALGTRAGTFDVVASMTSSLANGTTIKKVTLTVE